MKLQDFISIFNRINEYLLEDRLQQKAANNARRAGDEGAYHMFFHKHLEMRKEVKEMISECIQFIDDFLAKYSEI